ncbi:hypothetical protein FA95DRAFT_1047861 [Auriscalpium vulgare]|uniref:Uncharacterized protein n=1 Tax=Auriscalpium vulgare TaxID=40419 RepID=A0ACB8S9V0_9AGAM|nr:hypothetical protein FA95DRAFT_1047861 [Auriscalpium vulgare]
MCNRARQTAQSTGERCRCAGRPRPRRPCGDSELSHASSPVASWPGTSTDTYRLGIVLQAPYALDSSFFSCLLSPVALAIPNPSAGSPRHGRELWDVEQLEGRSKPASFRCFRCNHPCGFIAPSWQSLALLARLGSEVPQRCSVSRLVHASSDELTKDAIQLGREKLQPSSPFDDHFP